MPDLDFRKPMVDAVVSGVADAEAEHEARTVRVTLLPLETGLQIAMVLPHVGVEREGWLLVLDDSLIDEPARCRDYAKACATSVLDGKAPHYQNADALIWFSMAYAGGGRDCSRDAVH